MGEEHWGQGYATEAAVAVRNWASGTVESTRLVAMIHYENTASGRVANKIGAVCSREVEFHGEPADL